MRLNRTIVAVGIAGLTACTQPRFRDASMDEQPPDAMNVQDVPVATDTPDVMDIDVQDVAVMDVQDVPSIDAQDVAVMDVQDVPSMDVQDTAVMDVRDVITTDMGVDSGITRACGNGRIEAEPTPCFPSAPTRTIAFNGASSVVVVDINRDLHLDLIVHNATTLNVFRGAGNGTFSAPTGGITTDPGPGDIELADIDRDGNLDVALAISTGVRLYWGDGAGGLTAGPTQAVTPPVGELAIGNLNGDTPLDLVIGSVLDPPNNTAILLGGTGRTLGPATYISSGGAQALSPAILDVNTDSRNDIVITNPNRLSNGTLGIATNRADGGFNAPTTVGTGCIHAIGLITGDLNRDGRQDAVVTSQTNNNLCVMLGTAGGFNTGMVTMVTPTMPYGEPVVFAIADLDTDGNNDVLTGVVANNLMRVFRGRGDGTLVTPSFTIPTQEGVANAAVGDFNEDGAPDIVMVNNGASAAGIAVYIATP